MKKRKTRILWKKVFLLAAFFFLFFLAFYLYFRTGVFTIGTYELVGVPEKYHESVNQKLHDIDTKKLYKVLPGNRVLSYHSSEIRAAIHELLPNTATISISATSFHTLKISVVAYQPLFKIGEHDAITKDAIMYTEINDIHELPVLSFASSSNASEDALLKITDILPKISASLFDVDSITIDEHGDAYIKGGKTHANTVIISTTSDMQKIWSNLVSAIDTEPLKSKLSNNKDALEYLDVRFGNKVFYKFTNDAHTAIIPPHVATTTASTTTSH